MTFTQEHDRLIKKKLIFSVLLSRSFITVVALVPFFVYLTFKKSAYPVFCVWNTDLVKPNWGISSNSAGNIQHFMNKTALVFSKQGSPITFSRSKSCSLFFPAQ